MPRTLPAARVLQTHAGDEACWRVPASSRQASLWGLHGHALHADRGVCALQAHGGDQPAGKRRLLQGELLLHRAAGQGEAPSFRTAPAQAPLPGSRLVPRSGHAAQDSRPPALTSGAGRQLPCAFHRPAAACPRSCSAGRQLPRAGRLRRGPPRPMRAGSCLMPSTAQPWHAFARQCWQAAVSGLSPPIHELRWPAHSWQAATTCRQAASRSSNVGRQLPRAFHRPAAPCPCSAVLAGSRLAWTAHGCVSVVLTMCP